MAQPQPNNNTNHEEYLADLAQTESDALQTLGHAVQDYETAITDVNKRFSERITSLVAEEAEARANLHNAIISSPESLWSKNKTRIVDVCKYGWRKQRGKIIVADQETAVERLTMLLGEDAEQHISTKQSVRKTTVTELSATVLKKAGITVELDTDEVVVQSTASELAKKIEKLRDSSLIDE